MIYPQLEHHHNRQAGVTLLLAVMIVSGISLISLTVAFLGIQEIRNSKSASLTGSAIGAADTGSEQGLWNAKRRNNVADCSGNVAFSDLGNNSASGVCKNYNAPITINLEANKEAELFLYDPNDINGDYDLRGCEFCDPPLVNSAGFNITNIKVNRTSGPFQVDVNVYRINNAVAFKSGVANDNEASINFVNKPGDENRMRVTFSSQSAAVIVVSTNKGIPSMATIESTGCAAAKNIENCNEDNIVSRKLEVTLPE